MAASYGELDQDPEEEYGDDDDFNCNECLKMLVHFVYDNCAPIIAFYIGLRSYLEKLSFWEVTHRVITIDHEVVKRNMTGYVPAVSGSEVMPWAHYNGCLKQESRSMVEAFSKGSNTSCVGVLPSAAAWGYKNVSLSDALSAINYVGLALVVIFILILLVELCLFHQARGIGQGRYIAFTFVVQGSIAFKVMSGILVLFIVLIFLDTLRFLYVVYEMGVDGFIAFLEDIFLTLVTLVYSAIKLVKGAQVKLPLFDVTAEEFKELQFVRGWSGVTVGNSDFVKDLGNAVCAAQLGQDSLLRNMCESSTKEVQDALIIAAEE